MSGTQPNMTKLFKTTAATSKSKTEANKENKEVKRTLKETTRQNKEILEAVKESKDSNSNRLETKITEMGTNIASSINELKDCMINFTNTMKDTINENKKTQNTNLIKDKNEIQTNTKESEQIEMLSESQLSQEILPNAQRPKAVKSQANTQFPASGKTQEESKLQTPPLPTAEEIWNRIETQQEEIENLHKRITELENKEPEEPVEVVKQAISTKPTTVKKTILTPTLSIDAEGNQNEITRTENQPFDWTTVRSARRKYIPRPELNDTTNEKVTEEINKLIEEKKEERGNKERKPQKKMKQKEREERIEKMLRISADTVGFAPFSNAHIDKVTRHLSKKGLLKATESFENRRQRTIKSLVKSWAYTNLKMSDREWDSIQVESVYQTQSEESNIIFLKCTTSDDAAKITSRAHNLPKSTGPDCARLVMHVDKRARARYAAYQTIAKTIRQQADNSIQTSIRIGKKDFLLRKKPRGDQTPWSQIPPLKITQDIPAFEIGVYKDIFANTISEDEDEDEDENEDEPDEDDQDMDKSNEIKRIEKELELQNKEEDKEDDEDNENKIKEKEKNNEKNKNKNKNKRNRSKEVSPSIQKNHRPKQRKQVQFSESDTDDENQKKERKYLNSTPIEEQTPTTIQKQLSIQQIPPYTGNLPRYNSVAETPQEKIRQNYNPSIWNQVLETPEKSQLQQNNFAEEHKYE